MSRMAGWRVPVRFVSGLLLAGWLTAAVFAEDDRVEVADGSEITAGSRDVNLVDLGANFDANVFDQRGDGWMLRGGVVRRAGRMGRIVLGEGEVFGGVVGVASPGEPGESPTLTRSRRLAEARLERVARICQLTAEQRYLLALAIESDLRRLAAEVDGQRRRYAGVTVNMADQDGQRQWHQFQQDVQRCRNRLQSIFDQRSLFAGALATVLEDGQRQRLAAETAARRRFRWQALVSAALVKIDEAAGLDERQYRLLHDQLLAREPRLRLDDESGPANPQAEQMLVFSTLADLEQAPLREAMSERQWRVVSTLAQQGRAMRSWLDQQGLVEPNPPPGGR
jgi:hypothetical protein